MKTLKKPKQKPTAILQQQSFKLKKKLDLLREQVNQKRLQKQMNKTATSLNKSSSDVFIEPNQQRMLSQTTKVNLTNNFKSIDSKLIDILVQNKLESLETKLKQKGVRYYDQLKLLNQAEIDNWKDIAVGWRIKLKKCIRNLKDKYTTDVQTNLSRKGDLISTIPGFNSTSLSSSINNSNSQSSVKGENLQKNAPSQPWIKKSPVTFQQNSSSSNEAQQKNIEEIIKHRKNEKIFVPLERQIQEMPEDEYEILQADMNDQDQQIIIQSFMKVFQPRKSCLKRNQKINMKKATQLQNSQIQSSEEKISMRQEQENIAATNKKEGKMPKKKVSWSRQVELMETKFNVKDHKTYPKQAISKQALFHTKGQQQISLQQLTHEKGFDYSKNIKRVQGQKSQNEEITYCWTCFRRVMPQNNILTTQIDGKYFCCLKCSDIYREQVEGFKQKINQMLVGEDASSIIQHDGDDALSSNKINGDNDLVKKDREECDQQDLQVIDLSIL